MERHVRRCHAVSAPSSTATASATQPSASSSGRRSCGDKIYECSQCDFITNSKYEYVIHSNKNHNH